MTLPLHLLEGTIEWGKLAHFLFYLLKFLKMENPYPDILLSKFITLLDINKLWVEPYIYVCVGQKDDTFVIQCLSVYLRLNRRRVKLAQTGAK